MSSEKEKKTRLIQMPSFSRFLIGGIVAYWLSSVMNPAFGVIALLVILIIPVLTVDNIFSRQFERAYNQPDKVVPKQISKSEYLASLGKSTEEKETSVEQESASKTKTKAGDKTKPKASKGKNTD